MLFCVCVCVYDKVAICWISFMSIVNLHSFDRHIDAIPYCVKEQFSFLSPKMAISQSHFMSATLWPNMIHKKTISQTILLRLAGFELIQYHNEMTETEKIQRKSTNKNFTILLSNICGARFVPCFTRWLNYYFLAANIWCVCERVSASIRIIVLHKECLSTTTKRD